MRVIQRRSAQIIHLLYLVVQIFLTYKRRLNILHDTKRKFLSIDNALAALTLMVAASKPSEKDKLIKVILNLMH